MVGRPASRTASVAVAPTLQLRPLVGVFVVGTLVSLVIIMVTGHGMSLGWLGVSLLMGLMATALYHASRLARHPARVAHAASGLQLKPHHEAMGGDPLAHIQVVEQQGRRHRRPCVNCGTMVKNADGACSNCGQLQVYPCKGCRTQVRLDWTNCPECGRGLP